jgi:hypothetical protein
MSTTTNNNEFKDTRASNGGTLESDWQRYDASDRMPWDKDPIFPGCEDWDYKDAHAAALDGVELYAGPDNPDVRERNRRARQQREADLERRTARLREIQTSNAIQDKRLGGFARNAIQGIIGDIVKVQQGPKWNITLYVKSGKLAGWFQHGFLANKTESDCKAMLLEAAAPWDGEERSARATIDSGWGRPIPPAIPDEIFERLGIRAEVRKSEATNINDGGTQSVGGRDDRETEGQTTDSEPPVFADKLLTRSDLRNLPPPEPLIDNVLDQGTIALLYGKWSTGKTFIALDWAACVATGKAWQNRKTEQRKVLYVVGEGASGLNQRADAWETGWQTMISDEWLSIYPHPINLLNDYDIDQLRALIVWGGYDLVIFDTLARCMVGADENSAKDGGIVIDNMTKLRDATPGGRGVILAVHHAGKDAKTLRGTSALESGVDTVYSTSRDEEGWISLNREKRKDGPEHDHHVFKIDPIPGTGSAVMSVSARHDGDGESLPSARSAELLALFTTNFEITGASGGTLRTVAEEAGMAKTTFYRALNDLVNRGTLVNEAKNQRPYYRLV